MRRTTALVAMVALAVLLASGVALARNITCPNKDNGSCVGTNKMDTITGTTKADAIKARGGDDTVTARGGNDKVSGGDGGDLLDGGSGKDRLNGGSNPDTALEFLAGGPGDDVLVESPGPDKYGFDGNWGQDEITGDGDPPSLQPNFDAVCFACGPGPTVTADLIIKLTTGTATDGTNTVTWTAPIIEYATGGSGADTITGNGRDNIISGLNGGDTINVAGDPTTASDIVDCGSGDNAMDTVTIDQTNDSVRNCTAEDVVTTVP